MAFISYRNLLLQLMKTSALGESSILYFIFSPGSLRYVMSTYVSQVGVAFFPSFNIFCRHKYSVIHSFISNCTSIHLSHLIFVTRWVSRAKCLNNNNNNYYYIIIIIIIIINLLIYFYFFIYRFHQGIWIILI